MTRSPSGPVIHPETRRPLRFSKGGLLFACSFLGLLLMMAHNMAVAEEPSFALTLPLVLNGRYLGDLAGEVSIDGKARVEYERLVSLLAHHLDETALARLREQTPTQGLYSVSGASVSPLELQYVPAELAIRVEAPHEFFVTRQLSLSGSGQPDPEEFLAPARASAALNVLYNQEYQHRSPDGELGRLPANALLEARGNFGGRNGLNLAGAGIYAEGTENRFQRRDARIFHDNMATATRYTLGDITPGVRGFQQSPRLGGGSISRLYGEIQPYRNIRSSGQRELILERPSTVDVEVDGVVVRTERLLPGRYQIEDFPLAIGNNDVRLLVEDDFGRREAAQFDPYHHPELLAPGTRLFDLSAGRIQDNEFGGSLRYSNQHALTGFLEQGLTERTTLGTDLQVSESGYHATGLGVRSGHAAGITGLNLSASGFHSGAGETGYAAGLSHQWNRAPEAEFPVNLGFQGEYFQSDYRTLLDPEMASNRRLAAGARVQFGLPRSWSAGVGVQRQDFHDETLVQRRQDLSLSRSFSGRGNLFASVQRTTGGAIGADADRYAASVGLSWRLGERGLVRSQYLTRDQRSRVAAQRLGGRGIHDLSGRASVSRSDQDEEVAADLRYRGNRANVAVQSRGTSQTGLPSMDDSRSTARLETGLAFADGRFGVAPRVSNGFVLYRPHESLRGHPLTIADGGGRRVRGRSDVLGPPTVPLQRAYLPENLDIAVESLPMGYDLGAQRESLLPGAFSGHVIPVGSDESRTILGYLVDESGDNFPQLTGHLVRITDGHRIPLFTNRMGRFVAERVAPGEYRMELGRWQSRETLTISSDSESLIDAGILEME